MSDTLRTLFSGTKGDDGATGDDDASQSTKEVRPDVTPGATIRVLGVGGGGCNAVKRMVENKVPGVDFIAVNTDIQALYHNPAPTKITVGRGTTRGLGAGANPEIGKKAAEESTEELKAALEGTDMLFLTTGLGGGTGTGGVGPVADLARSMDILTVGVVTKPFSFEGAKRKKHADEGIESLKDKVDTLITIPNDRILSLIDKTTPLTEAFQVVDEVLQHAIEGISNLITVHGLVNVDFADVKTIMQDAGTALMGIGYGTGDSRAAEAARAAIDSPLLELSIDGAKGIMFNVTGGNDLSMFEVDEAARIVTEAADPDAMVIFGAVIDESYTGEVKCTVVATGFEESEISGHPSLRPSIQRPAAGTVGSAINASAASMPASTASEPQTLPMEDTENAPILEARSTAVDLNEEELEVPAFMRKKVSTSSEA